MRKIKSTILLLIFIILSSLVSAQPFANSWINYGQQYFTVKIYSEGVYRINYTTLTSANIPVANFDPRSFQIYKNGVEQPIYVRGEQDGIFNVDDFIEFYGTGNDGWLDSAAYSTPSSQANKAYSLYNDTATYFLTWNSVSPLPNGKSGNKRLDIQKPTDYSSYTPSNYFIRQSRSNYTSKYLYGQTDPVTEASDPELTSGEGWYGVPFGLYTNITSTVNTSNVYAAGPAANIEIVVAGASDYADLAPDHHLQITYSNQTIDSIFDGYGNLKFKRNLPASSLTNGLTSFTLYSLDSWGVSQNTAYMALSYIDIKYPHNLDLENKSLFKFYAPNTNEIKTYFSFTNFNIATYDSIFVYDFSNNKRISAQKGTSSTNVLIDNNGQLKECVIFTSSTFNYISALAPVNSTVSSYAKFTDFTTPAVKAKNYIIISHKSLMSEVAGYSIYRNSSGYNTLVVDIDELYNQFAYGICKHPMSIRNFCKFIVNTFDSIPKGLFLIGKSYTLEKYRNNTSLYAGTLVPSFGNPPSDVLFSATINDPYFKPAIPTGRLSAKIPFHVYLYKNKVSQYEQAQQNPQEWMKRVLHFGGGNNLAQQNTLAGYLSGFEATIKKPLFGGVVSTFLKSSSAPIQITTSDSLRTLINGGVSMLTFFGHAAGIGFDQSIDHPSEYSNYGKYPFLLANSCLAGNIFNDSTSSSEEFVLIENKGVIGYLASVSTAEASPLDLFSGELYQNIANKLYGKTIGSQIQATIKNIEGPSQIIKQVCYEMVLHGDPAIKINFSTLPDYTINSSNVYTTPSLVTTESDPFVLHIIATNIGKAPPTNDSMIVEIVRTFPDGITQTTIDKRIKAPYYKDTLNLSIPVDVARGIGLNKFRITLDAFNEIAELSETNNTTTFDLNIKSNDITPIYPYKYAVIPSQTAVLKASTGDPFAPIRKYRFEIDTTDVFNSPAKISTSIQAKGGVVTYTVPIVLKDSIVYYWHVSRDTIIKGNYNWRESSFQYIQNKSGWGQAHYFQFKNDKYQFVNFDRPNRRYKFANNENSIFAQTGVYPYIAWNDVKSELNGSLVAFYNCAYNGILFDVFDSISAQYWVDKYDGISIVPYTAAPYGNYHCKSEDLAYFDFYTQSTSGRANIKNFLTNVVPKGDYVLAYSHENSYIKNDTTLYAAFESIGSALIRSIPNNRPFIIFGKKGAPIGSAHEVIGPTSQSIIQLQDSIKTRWNVGHIESEIIGPASHWGSLHWRYRSLDAISHDSINLSVVGIKVNGTIDTLMKNIAPTAANKDLLNLSTYADATQYPYLKLVAFMRDDSLRTPSQMIRWQVLFTGMPETALNPSLHYSLKRDTVNEGENVTMSIATQNISEYNMDSLLISYWVIDHNRVMHNKIYHHCRKHPSGDILIDSITFPTIGFGGLNSLWVEVNPINPTKGVYDQLEQYHFNNIAQIPFFVKQDNINPLLDVTFDGIRILNGDIVSAKPTIEIRLKDENRYLALNDTSIFKVFIQYPNEYAARRIYFNSNGIEQLSFYPAALPNNTCRIEYKPTFADNKYTLIVQAKDVSRNQSGDIDYKVSFEVINKPSITNMMNWPNPFSTKTHFVFTLTGSEIPDYMKIQIMTITGKVVREIDLSELGPIHIGRNITDYAWDGKDEFGDQLANGVYLYRVITKLNGMQMDQRASGADTYIKNNFGKMYLMR